MSDLITTDVAALLVCMGGGVLGITLVALRGGFRFDGYDDEDQPMNNELLEAAEAVIAESSRECTEESTIDFAEAMAQLAKVVTKCRAAREVN